MVYDQFQMWCLWPGETVNVFLAELKKPAIPIAPLPEEWMTRVFMSELPNHVKQILCALSRMEDMTLNQLMRKNLMDQWLWSFNQLKSKRICPQPYVAMAMSPVIGALGQIILPKITAFNTKKCTTGCRERHVLIYNVSNVIK